MELPTKVRAWDSGSEVVGELVLTYKISASEGRWARARLGPENIWRGKWLGLSASRHRPYRRKLSHRFRSRWCMPLVSLQPNP